MSRNDDSFRVSEKPQPIQVFDPTSYRVNLQNRYYDCGKFQALKTPCEHVIVVCSTAMIDFKNYIDLVYYEMEFPPIDSETEWEKTGCPKSTRIQNVMDDMHHRERKPNGQPKLCGNCKLLGHRMPKCPSRK
ncbi:hypothetical protein HRI_004471300 [Hibiscus trionum]|uniref:SWIM-type domain-containing protein n=1 Tax=Hibiscus trionum TaxID=183268 RepID=A0A9W7MSW5_HIBTR|nr:hypothetical protein HRI_004471300 [Hibiscus trionum]